MHVTLYCTWLPSGLATGLHGQALHHSFFCAVYCQCWLSVWHTHCVPFYFVQISYTDVPRATVFSEIGLSSSLQVKSLLFCLWNQLPDSFRQPRSSSFTPDSPHLANVRSSFPVDSPLSAVIHHSFTSGFEPTCPSGRRSSTRTPTGLVF